MPATNSTSHNVSDLKHSGPRHKMTPSVVTIGALIAPDTGTVPTLDTGGTAAVVGTAFAAEVVVEG